MARQSRQARRAHDRRLHDSRRHHHQRPRITWQTIAGTLVVLAAIAFFGYKALNPDKKSTTNAATTGTSIPNGPSVGAVKCDQGMSSGNQYHIHAHISLIRAGKSQTITTDAGHYYNQDCLYWLHAHDNVGIIHLEAPHKVTPTLATYLQVLARTLPGGKPNIDPGPGQTRKIWLNLKPYTGNPMDIPIVQHNDITIEIGPPFTTPKKFDFKAHGV
jgi:hypothetical protein